jgi:hypothetical protein
VPEVTPRVLPAMLSGHLAKVHESIVWCHCWLAALCSLLHATHLGGRGDIAALPAVLSSGLARCMWCTAWRQLLLATY